MTNLANLRDTMEHLINIGLGVTVYTIGVLASVTLDEKSVLPLSIVAAIVVVIWRISGSWTKVTNQLAALTQEVSDMRNIMRSRPCIKKGECDFITDVKEQLNERKTT